MMDDSVKPEETEVAKTLRGCGTVVAMACVAAFAAVLAVVLLIVGLVAGLPALAGFGAGLAVTAGVVMMLLFASSGSVLGEDSGLGPAAWLFEHDGATAVAMDRGFARPLLLVAAVGAGVGALLAVRAIDAFVQSWSVWQAYAGALAPPAALALYVGLRLTRRSRA